MLRQLYLLDKNENYLCLLSNYLPKACGINDFRQIQEARVDGTYNDTCLLIVPAKHTDIKYIIEGNYILFRDLDGQWQEYRIVNVESQYGTQSYILVTGENVFYELRGEPIGDKRPTSTTAMSAAMEVLDGTRWTIGTVAGLGNNSIRLYKTNALAALAAIALNWGGELQFRVVVSGAAVIGRYVDIVAQRGKDTGKRFEYKKDLIGIVQTVNTQSLATALIGRGKGLEIEETGGYGRRIEFADVEWSIENGDPADKPQEQNWIGDDDAAAAWGYGGRHIYDYANFSDCEDAEELLSLTYAELQRRKEPETTYEMTAVTLEGIAGYDHEAVRFGDTVGVVNSAVTPIATGQARIIRIDRSYIDLRSCNVTIGNYIPALTDAATMIQTQQYAMLSKIPVWDRANVIERGGDLEYRIDLLKTQLAATTTHFYTDANGNFIFENDNQTAALKLGAGVLALANSKTSGEWNWRTFGTGDGFTADEIRSGTLISDVIFAGELFGARGTFLDLISGDISGARQEQGVDESGNPYHTFYDNEGNEKISVLKDGVWFDAGTRLTGYTTRSGKRSGVAIFIN